MYVYILHILLKNVSSDRGINSWDHCHDRYQRMHGISFNLSVTVTMAVLSKVSYKSNLNFRYSLAIQFQAI